MLTLVNVAASQSLWQISCSHLVNITISLADFMLTPSETWQCHNLSDFFPLVDVRKLLEEAKQQC